MIKQCKGKSLDKVPASKLLPAGYYESTKYDGNYCQIHKIGDTVTVYSSGNKTIKLNDLEEFLVENNSDKSFILEAEFIGLSEGKLGDRTKCGIMTTWRTLTAKGLPCNVLDNKFVVFDIIVANVDFDDRLKLLKTIKLPDNLFIPEFTGPISLSESKGIAKDKCKSAWEGSYIKHRTHICELGKRVNTAIKLKLRPTADLLCINIEDGEGKYEGMIGSLVLQDSKGRIVKVGSGLNDDDRAVEPNSFIGNVIEIEYEQILDTYIQPTFITIRLDKTKKEID